MERTETNTKDMKTKNMNSNNMNSKEEVKDVKHKVTYDNKVIEKIVGNAAQEVEGIQPLSGGLIGTVTDKFKGDDKTIGVDAEVGEKQVAIDLNVVVMYGVDVPQTFSHVIEKAKAQIKKMTGLELVEMNMHVEDVLNKNEFDKKDTSSDDKKEKDQH